MSENAELIEGLDANDTIQRLTEDAHAAKGRGDRDEARRIFERRAAVAARFDESIEDGEARPEAPAGSGKPDDPGLPGEPEFDVAAPEPLGPEEIRGVVSNLRESGVSEEALEALHDEWGVDAGANLGYAAEFMRRLMDENPEFAAAVDRERKGVGQALLNHALAALRSEDVDVAMTYGDPDYYGQVGFMSITEDQVRAPLPLSFPEGWLGQSLTGQQMPTLEGRSTCVPALKRADVW